MRFGEDRRFLLRALAASLGGLPTIALAQRAERARRIGVLSPGPTLAPEEYRAVWLPLRELGWVEGRNVVFERRWADGRTERLRSLAAELVSLDVDVIATIGKDATAAAKAVTSRTPIVMLTVDDPVEAGLVDSLSRPGGNVTGVSAIAPELDAKRLELLRDIVPRLSRVGVLSDPTTAISGFSRDAIHRTYRAQGIEPVFVETSSAEDFDEAAARLVKDGAQAVVVHNDVVFVRNGDELIASLLRRRLPAAVEDRAMLRAGALVAYTNDTLEQLRRFAVIVDKILRGARPSDVPVEQPMTFRLSVNLNTARALGLVVPPSVLLRADEVIR